MLYGSDQRRTRKLAGKIVGRRPAENGFRTRENSTGDRRSVETASTTDIGGIKVGTNLSIDGNGVLSATDTTYSDFIGSGSSASSGLVPAPPTTAGTTKYLREDGSWSVPSGGGGGGGGGFASIDTSNLIHTIYDNMSSWSQSVDVTYTATANCFIVGHVSSYFNTTPSKTVGTGIYINNILVQQITHTNDQHSGGAGVFLPLAVGDTVRLKTLSGSTKAYLYAYGVKYT